MARVNVESEIYGDYRFRRLVRLVGDEDKALGLLVRFWGAAQVHWGNECALMPLGDFEVDGFEFIAQAGLAEVTERGVYAKGSEVRFNWYLQKCRASRAAVALRKKPSGVPAGNEDGLPAEPVRCTGGQLPDDPLLSSIPLSSSLDTEEQSPCQPPQLPQELDTPEILRVLESRAITREGIRFWARELFPDPGWLRREILAWDLEADTSPEFRQLPPVTRLRKWLEKHWEEHRERQRAQAPPAGTPTAKATADQSEWHAQKTRLDEAVENTVIPMGARRFLADIKGIAKAVPDLEDE